MQSLKAWLTRCDFQNKLLKSAETPLNWKSILPHLFKALVHYTFSGEEALQCGLEHKRWDPVFKSAILGRDRRKIEQKTAQRASIRTFPVAHMEKPEDIKYGCCCAP